MSRRRPGAGPDPRRAARRLAITGAVFSGVVYLLGWAGPEPDIYRVLNTLTLVIAVGALLLGRASSLVWAAVAAVVAACVGLASLPLLDGPGILAVMCSVPAAAAVAGAWFAHTGRTRWLPPTLFPPESRESAVTTS